MANKCLTFNPEDDNEDLVVKLYELSEELNGLEGNTSGIIQAYARGVQAIGSGYSKNVHPSVAEYIDNFAEVNFSESIFDEIPFQCTLKYMKEEGESLQQVIDRDIKAYEEDLETRYMTEQERTEIDENRKHFLMKAYGNADEVRSRALVRVKRELADCILFNRESGTITRNDKDLNDNLRDYQNRLLASIAKYINPKTTVDLSRVIENPNIETDYGQVMLLARDKLKPADVKEAFAKSIGFPNSKYADFINAYNAMVFLSNFDNFIKLQYGSLVGTEKVIEEGKVVTKYTLAGTGSNVRKNVIKDDNKDVSLEETTSALVRAIIDTMPFYKWQSGSPLVDRNLGLSEMYYITSKIKRLRYSSTAKDIYLSRESNSKGYNWGFERGETLQSLVSKMDKNYQVYYPQVLQVLTTSGFMDDHPEVFSSKGQNSSQLGGFYFTASDKNFLYSLYKNIFESGTNSSLKGLYDKYPPMDKNYYSYIGKALVDVDASHFIQYRFSEDGYVVQANLQDSIANSARRNKEIRINGNLSIINEPGYQSLKEKYFSGADQGYNKDTGKFKFSFYHNNRTKVSIEYNPKTTDVDITINKETKQSLETRGDWDKVKAFVGDILKLNIAQGTDTYDAGMEQALLDEYTRDGALQVSLMTDLLKAASGALFNSYFSNELINRNIITLKSGIDKRVREVFGTAEEGGRAKKIVVSPISFEINAVSTDMIGTLEHVAIAEEIVTGAYSSGMVRDGAGNAINSISPKKLAGNIPNQYVELGGTPKSAVSKMVLLQDIGGVFKGVGYARDIVDGYNVKKNTEFNVLEMFDSAFIANYLNPLSGNNDSATRKSYVAVFPSPISDKGQILHVLLDMNAPIIDTGTNWSRRLNGRLWKSLSKEELLEISREELLDYYTQVKSNINSDLEKVNTFIASMDDNAKSVWSKRFGIDLSVTPLPSLNYGTDFSEFNDAFKNASITPAEALHDIVVEMQKLPGYENFRLIDQTHYVNDHGKLARKRGIDASIDRNSNPEAHSAFWSSKEAQVLQGLLRAGYKLDLYDLKGKILPGSVYDNLSKVSGWVDTRLGRIILGKITVNGVTTNVSNLNELQQALGEFVNIKDKDFDLAKLMEANPGQISIELHPDIAKFNALHYLFGLEYVISSVGNPYNHDVKKNRTNPDFDIEDAASLAAQNKRNVSQTANKHSFGRMLLEGVPDTYRVAVIEDDKAIANNLVGSVGEVKQFDGATIVAPDVVYLENESLRADRPDLQGINKKQFVHFYDAETGTGGIIKTAGFGITNQKILASAPAMVNGIAQMPFYKSMVYKMWNRVWKNSDGSVYMGDITKDYLGNSLTVGKGSQVYDKIFFRGREGMFTNISAETVGIVNGAFYEVAKLEKAPGVNTYTVVLNQVGEDGITIPNSESISFTATIDTNYKLWQLFGGETSMELKNIGGDERLVLSETSIRNVVKAENNIGVVKPGLDPSQVKTQDDLFQPLKYSGIQYVVTAGAIKQGGANINSKNAYYSDSYELATMTFKPLDIGVQLDAEHEADNAHLSLMTQVVNALSARGYMTEFADEVYEALRGMSMDALSEYLNEDGSFRDISDEEFKSKVVQVVTKSFMNSTGRDGKILETMAMELVELVKNHGKLTYQSTKGVLPLSHPGVFGNLVALLNSALNKTAIKMSFDGSLAVLNPSHNIHKLYGGKFYGDYISPKDIETLQKEKYDKEPLALYQLRLQRHYKVGRWNSELGKMEIVDNVELTTPEKYWEVTTKYKDATFYEDITKGRNLGEYNFTAVAGGKAFNMWDLDVVKALHLNRKIDKLREKRAKALKNGNFDKVQEISNSIAFENANLDALASGLGLSLQYESNVDKALREVLQNTLNAVGAGELSEVVIDRQRLQVDKSSLEVSPYEVIMPMVYATKYGLTEQDNLDDIRADRKFFLNRMLKNWGNVLAPTKYHLILKRLDGKHIYLQQRDKSQTEKVGLIKAPSVELMYDGNKVYRFDDGHKGTQMGSIDDEIYTDQNGAEVILTDNIQFYLDNYDYTTVQASSTAIDSGVAGEIIDSIIHPANANPDTPVELSNNVKDFIEGLGSDIKDAKSINKRLKAINALETKSIIKASADLLKVNDIEDPFTKRIVKSALEIHTSFIKSLDVLAARIPAQSMQSFMPMRVAGFDKANLNNAYVSHYQFWLQGSDLDIDKVSLLGCSFGLDGRFIGWSPFFKIDSIENLKLSETLPFPSGKTLVGPSVGEDAEMEALLEEAYQEWAADPKHETEVDETIDYGRFYGGKIVAKYTPSLPLLAKVLRAVRKRDAFIIPENIDNNEKAQVIRALFKAVNKHNSYLKNSYNREKALKNFVATYMLKISSNPVSLIQSQSPIDEPVKVLKTKGNESDTEGWDKYDAFGNCMAAFKAFVKNQTGKACVAISASGMKSVEGFIHYYSKRLANPEEYKQMFLVPTEYKTGSSPKVVCGHEIGLLANSWTKSSNIKNLDPIIQDLLGKVDQSEDALITISAILGAAVDNAKDPILGKINGGSNMLPMYLYGIAMGIPFEDVSNCMMSEPVREIANLMSGNVFQDDYGYRNALSAVRYVKFGPTSIPYGKAVMNLIVNKTDPSSSIFGVKKEEWDDKGKSKVSLATRWAEAIANGTFETKLEALRTAVNLTLTDKDLIIGNRFVEKLSNWYDLYLLAKRTNLRSVREDALGGEEVVEYNALDSFEQLALGAAEFRRIRPIFGLNKEVKTNLPDLLTFKSNFAKIFSSRKQELSPEQLNESVIILDENGEPQSITRAQIFNRINELNPNEDSDIEDGIKGISFEKFVTDEKYRNQLIHLYDGVKHSINILDAVTSIPHYVGYMSTAYVALEQLKASDKYRFADKMAPRIFKDNAIVDSVDKQQAIKRLMTVHNVAMNNKYLRVSNSMLTIPINTVINKQGKKSTSEITILLGTNEGNLAFKNWMDSVVIPNLKQGIVVDSRGKSSKSYDLIDNAFIRGIDGVAYNKTSSGNPVYSNITSINTMPRSDYDKIKFQTWKVDFDKLFSRTYAGNNIGELFFYYNMINYNMEPGQNNFSSLFEDLYYSKDSTAINRYTKFISDIDNQEGGLSLTEGVDYNYEDILKVTAPVSQRFNEAKGKYVRVRNYTTLQYELYKRKPKPSKQSQQSQNPYDPDYGDDFGDDWEEDNPIVENGDYAELINDYDNNDPSERKKEFEKNDKYEKVSESKTSLPWTGTAQKYSLIQDSFILGPEGTMLKLEKVGGNPTIQEVHLKDKVLKGIKQINDYIKKINERRIKDAEKEAKDKGEEFKADSVPLKDYVTEKDLVLDTETKFLRNEYVKVVNHDVSDSLINLLLSDC